MRGKLKDNSGQNEFQDIKRAAELRLRLEPWRFDKEFTDQGGRIYYAVDTNIVKMFTNPISLKNYARFLTDDDRTCEILAWALSRFIFFRLTDSSLPLLIIPPHHKELERVFNAIAHVALADKGKFYSENLNSIVSKIKPHFDKYKRTKNMEALISSLENDTIALALFAYGGGNGPTAEMTRITDLLEKGRLLHIDHYYESSSEKPWTLPVLPVNNNQNGYETLCNYVKSWTERFGKTKEQKITPDNASNDAKVLAHLEWINRDLGGDKKRLVLISGDQALHKTAGEYKIDGEQTFADLYIRDPRVFMATPDFILYKREGKIVGDLIGWLDTFFANYQPGISNKRLHEISKLGGVEGNKLAKEFLKKSPDCISKLREDWQKHVYLTAMEYGFKSTEDQFKDFLEHIEAKDDVDEVKREINSMISEVVINLWKSASYTGLWSMVEELNDLPNKPKSADQLPLRGIPVLRLPIVNNILEKLTSTLQTEEIIGNKTSFEQITCEEQSGYAAFLLHALAFGAKCRWKVSVTLSTLALHIAKHEAPNDKLSKGVEPITGNEAWYLLAWATRHTAKTASELSAVKQYMKKAISCKAKALKAIGIDSDGYDIRYESEFVAIHMTYHLFRIFKGETIPDGLEIPPLSQCQSRIVELLEELELENLEKEYIRVMLKKQLLTYLFSILLLRQFKEDETGMEREIQDIPTKWFPEFEIIMGSKELRTQTCLTKPIYDVACYFYGTAKKKQQKHDCAEDVNKILNKDKVKSCYLMPYDEEFYGFLRDIVNDYCKRCNS
ncbi:MAG: hypothetical protein HQK89_05190 [Nitrospirae bacterium]|nr:hypothetical protein [Nitrospirota bacterium]